MATKKRKTKKEHEAVLVTRRDGFAVCVDAVGDHRVAISTSLRGTPLGPALVLPREQFEHLARGWLDEYGAGHPSKGEEVDRG